MKEGTKDSLIKESKKVSHDNDDGPRQSDDDLLDLVHPLGGVLDFWNTGTQSTSLNLLSTDNTAPEGCSDPDQPGPFPGFIHWFGTEVQAENRAQCSSAGEFTRTFRFSINSK